MKYIIVTNTINRPVTLVERSLRASLNQKIPPIKVILIDQNRTPIKLPKDIAENSLFQVQKVDYLSVSAARNNLNFPSETEWIFFCDDDGYPCEDYSERLLRIISENANLEILAGSIVRDDNNEFYSLRHKKGGSLKYFRNTKNLMGSNFVIKVDTFLNLGKFDENFGVGSYWGSSEETDFCWNAYFNNVKMEFFPELKVYHVPPFNESVKGGFIKAFYYGVGKGALVAKWIFIKKEPKVIYEFIEMLVVPLLQSARGILTLKPQLIVTNFISLYGRIFGVIKFLIGQKTDSNYK